MHCDVVKVGTQGLGDVEAIARSLRNLTEVLLLIQDVVLCACDMFSDNNDLVVVLTYKQSHRHLGFLSHSLLRQSQTTLDLARSLPSFCHQLVLCRVDRPLGQVDFIHVSLVPSLWPRDDLHVDSLVAVLLAHVYATLVPGFPVPSCSHSTTGWKNRDIISKAHTQRCILETERREA